RAGSIGRRQAVAAWLYRVAVRVALRARRQAARRGAREHLTADPPPIPVHDDPAASLAVRELRRVLDEEVNRLPARCRDCLVLCLLDGHTQEEAGRLLGCPKGTVSTRLTRARELLRRRLASRGFLPAAAAAVLAADAAPAPALLRTTA